jgi:MoaA/NifB/PqqE/SkfB family radical SAM enzyme
MGIFDRLKRDKKNRRFGAWQVEITTRCNLRCTMCIKTVGKHHHHQDMTIHDFEKIVPYLHEVKNVVLEGWGESLLHKNLVDFIRLAKTAGPEVGFVTSGMGLSAEYATQIIGAGVDFIGFSLSGATSKTHNAIRVNSDFEPIIGAIKTVKRLSLENPAERPKLHIVYLMLKDNVHEIPDLLDLANEIGINEIVLLNIVQVTDNGQDNQKAFSCDEGFLYRDIMKKASDKAKRLNINISMPEMSPRDVAVCSENPLNNLYISVSGEVSPCVFLNPPVASPFRRIFCGSEYPVHSVSFGNIFSEPLESLWEKSDYKKFRNAFITRQKRWEAAYASLLEMRSPDTTPLPLPPVQCRTCHKMLGY